MPGSSNILQWNSAQTNTEDDAAYAADTVRTGGAAVDGILPSATANKMFYQWSTFLAALGQALANKGYTISDASLTSLTAVLANVITAADLGEAITTVPYATSVTFDAATISPIIGAFEITLTGNVASSTLSNFVPGQVIIFIVVQDGVGGRTFSWPAQLSGAQVVAVAPNSATVQAFVVTEESAVLPLVPVPSNVSTQTQPGNVIDTPYQNTGTTPRFVSVIVACPAGAYATAVTDSSVTPTTSVGVVGTVNPGLGGSYTLTFIVLPGNYYAVNTQAGSPYLQGWTEWQ